MMLSDSIFKISEINRIRDIHSAYENEKKLRQIESLSSEKREQSIKISHQRWALVSVVTALLVFLAMTVVLIRQKRKLHQTYVHLFHSHKETLAAQSEKERREESMRREIERLRGELEKKEPAVSRQPHFSINALAEATGVNSRYLSQVINDTYGCNFRAKLNECRMTIAQRRILDIRNYGNLTIQAIAESVGYRSQSGFVQLFKKATGFTPSLFQKMAKEDN